MPPPITYIFTNLFIFPEKKKIPNVSDSYGGERVQDSSNWVRSKPKVLAVPVLPGTFGPVWLESVGVSTGGGEYGLSRKRGGREEDLAATESFKRTRTSVCLDLLGGGISRGPFILDFEEVSVKPLSEYGTVQDGDAVVSGRLAVGDDPSRYGSSSLRPIGARKRTRQDMDAALRVPKKRSRTSFTPSITASAATDSRSMSSGVSCVSAAQLYSASDTTMMSQYLGDSGAVVAGGGPSALPVAAPSVFSTAVTTVPGDVCVQELPEAPYGPVRVETLSTLQPPTLGRRARPSTHRRTRSGGPAYKLSGSVQSETPFLFRAT